MVVAETHPPQRAARRLGETRQSVEGAGIPSSSSASVSAPPDSPSAAPSIKPSIRSMSSNASASCCKRLFTASRSKAPGSYPSRIHSSNSSSSSRFPRRRVMTYAHTRLSPGGPPQSSSGAAPSPARQRRRVPASSGATPCTRNSCMWSSCHGMTACTISCRPKSVISRGQPPRATPDAQDEAVRSSE